MTVRLQDDLIRIEGMCRVEEAETLTTLLQSRVDAAVDLSACAGMHSAVVQVLLAFRPRIEGTPGDAFVREHLLPALADRWRDAAATSSRHPYGRED